MTPKYEQEFYRHVERGTKALEEVAAALNRINKTLRSIAGDTNNMDDSLKALVEADPIDLGPLESIGEKIAGALEGLERYA